MKVIEVFENNQPVALLTPESDGIQNVWVEEKLNGPVTLTFVLPRDSGKWQYLTDAYRLRVAEHEFLVTSTSEAKTSDGQLWSNVQCEAAWVELGDLALNYRRANSINATAWGMLNRLVNVGYMDEGETPAGRGWVIGTVEPEGQQSLAAENETCLQLLWRVRALFGGDLVLNTLTKNISLYNQYGSQRAVQLRLDKNLKSLKRTIDYGGIVTRLVPMGQAIGEDGNVTIASVNGGLTYIEDFSYTNKVIEKVWVAQDYSDPAKLKVAAEAYLAELAQPRVSYEVDLLDMREVTDYGVDIFGLGDTVTVYDADLGLNIDLRVVTRRYDPFFLERGSVELANSRRGIENELSRSRSTSDAVENVMLPEKHISGRRVIITDEAFMVCGEDSGTRLVSKGVKVFDGNGVLRVHLGQIAPGVFGLWTDAGTIEAGDISGVSISGSTITGSLIKSAATGARFEITDTQIVGYPDGSDIGVQMLFDMLRFWKDGSMRGVLQSTQETDGVSTWYTLQIRASEFLELYANGLKQFFGDGYQVIIRAKDPMTGTEYALNLTPDGILNTPGPVSAGVNGEYAFFGRQVRVKEGVVFFIPAQVPPGEEGLLFLHSDGRLRLYFDDNYHEIPWVTDIPSAPDPPVFERKSTSLNSGASEEATGTISFSGTISKVLGVWSGHQRINVAQTGGGDGYNYVTVAGNHVHGTTNWSANAYAAAVLA